ncbi:MAG: serine/threonine-protein kinase, partial [Myxococcota bacterium]
AMEFIDGMPLEDFAEKAKPDRDTWLRIMLGVCRAVQYAHQKGIIHRDLKPDNVMVTQEREPKVVDFGIAKLVETDRPDQGNSKLTSDGAFLGTPAYMSPEQIQAKPGSIDTRTDVYALGVMLYEQLVGQHPHGDETTDNMLILFMKVVNEEPLNPRRINPDIDREMEALLLKAIARDPAERYDSAGELADDLQRYLDGEPLLAKPQTVVYVLRKKIAKHRGKFALGVLTVAAFAAFALFSYVTVLDERNKAQDARAVAEEARTQAEKRFELGRNFARTLIFDLDDTILNEGLTPARALFVAESKTYLDRLRADAGNRFDVQEEIARAYIKIGNIQRDLAKTDAAISSLETAHDSYKTLAKRARSKKRRARYPELAELATSGALARGRAESLYHLADIRRE